MNAVTVDSTGAATCCVKSVASQSGSMYASRLHIPPRSCDAKPVLYHLLLFKHLFFYLCNSPSDSVYPPFSFFFTPSSGIYFLFSRCYSWNAKSEIEEVTHVTCLAMVCLDAALSGKTNVSTPSFTKSKELPVCVNVYSHLIVQHLCILCTHVYL